MAVTTEPPWLNQSSGTAARNGTTSHTISFGFTSTSGSLLVFVVFGAVTHAASGWTEQLSPVNSGELSVFTKTSAGDTSITVTHNGSNYPVVWAAYEFPAGSTYTTGTSDTANSDAYPALSGLPGTEQVVIAARGRTAASASETSASAAWSAPWVEDADQFVAFATTDGGTMTVAHQINVTTTSVTPTDTPTYGGSWGTGDREKVVFALDVAVAGSGGVAVVGTARAVGIARAVAAKVVNVTARCVATATATATVRKVLPATARSVAAPSGTAVAKHVGVASGRQAAAPTAAATVVKRLAATGTATGAASAVMSGSSRAVTGRCVAAARTGAVVSRSTAVVGVASAAPMARAIGVRRTPVIAVATALAVARAVAVKRLAAAGRAVAAAAATGVAGQAGSTRPVTGRCTAAAICRSRTRHRTPRPYSGITVRPNSGITYRP